MGKSMQEDGSSGIQFSLRNMWIGLLVVGSYVGIMGRLFLYSPNLFYSIWGLTVTVVPFLLAIISLIYVSRNLPSSHKIRLWAVALALTPFLGLLCMPLFRTLQATIGTEPSLASVSPGDYATIATDKLVSKYLPPRVQEPWVWDELEKRLAADDMTREQVAQAIDTWIVELEQSQFRHISWQRRFLVAARKADLIEGTQLIELHRAFLEKPEIETERLRESNKQVEFDVDIQHIRADELPYDIVWDVTNVEVDGVKMQYKIKHRSQHGFAGTIAKDLTAGKHKLAVQLKLAFVDRDRLVGLNFQSLDSTSWPKTVKVWEETIESTYDVYEDAKPVIKLVDDPKQNPSQFINPKLIVQNDGDKKKLILEISIRDAPISCSFQCSVHIDEKQYALGTKYVAHTGSSTHSNGGQRSVSIDPADLPSDIETANVILVPDPSLVFRLSGVEEIWGKEIVIPAVPIKRYDLETQN